MVRLLPIRPSPQQAMGPAAVHVELAEALGETSEILFFLLGAMSIVEVVDSHQVAPSSDISS